jgi:hypothetical protein
MRMAAVPSRYPGSESSLVSTQTSYPFVSSLNKQFIHR